MLTSQKSAIKVFILATFLGIFGAHRFYVGKKISGMVQLLTFGGLGIWTLIDWVHIANGTFDDSNGRKIIWRKDLKGNAGFWIRFAAHLIDMFIIWLISLFTFMAVILVNENTNIETSNEIILGKFNIINLLVAIIYYLFLTASNAQATIGKRMVGIYVIRSDGKKIDLPTSILRVLGYVISYLTMLVGFFMIGWTTNKTGLHDLIAKTYVVYGKAHQQKKNDKKAINFKEI